jgi:hypothetical protein
MLQLETETVLTPVEQSINDDSWTGNPVLSTDESDKVSVSAVTIESSPAALVVVALVTTRSARFTDAVDELTLSKEVEDPKIIAPSTVTELTASEAVPVIVSSE